MGFIANCTAEDKPKDAPFCSTTDLPSPLPLTSFVEQDGSGTLVQGSGDSFSGEWRRGLINGPVVFKFGDKSPWNDPEY